jgi:hypothetical protein
MTIPASGGVIEPSLTQLNPAWKDWLDVVHVFAMPQCSEHESFAKRDGRSGYSNCAGFGDGLRTQKRGGTARVALCRQVPDQA